MYSELYAIATALIRGISIISTRRGLQFSNPNTSALIYMLINTGFLWLITIFLYQIDQVFVRGIEYFVLAGVVAPGIAVLFRDVGLTRLGVAITSPIVGTNTFISMLIAVIFLGEDITTYLVFGAILIFVGVNILTWRGRNRAIWRGKDLIFPVAAASFFATSVSLRKIGLLKVGYPIIGATITSTVSLLTLIVSLIVTRVHNVNFPRIKLNREAITYFGLSGFALSVAFALYFMALSSSPIVKIQPIAGTDPLFAIMFSYIFLKDLEKITLKIVFGTILIISGIILITI